MKIVNIKKFIRMVLIVVGILVSLSLYFSNNSYSKGEVKEKEIFVSRGDTLWSIASFEQQNNSYYENKDVREIIQDIKNTNNLNSCSNLKVGQTIKIYTF